jgi:hypothetical protein
MLPLLATFSLLLSLSGRPNTRPQSTFIQTSGRQLSTSGARQPVERRNCTWRLVHTFHFRPNTIFTFFALCLLLSFTSCFFLFSLVSASGIHLFDTITFEFRRLPPPLIILFFAFRLHLYICLPALLLLLVPPPPLNLSLGLKQSLPVMRLSSLLLDASSVAVSTSSFV